MKVRPFSLIGTSTLERMTGRLRIAAETWCGDWGLAPGAISIACHRAWELKAQPEGQWQQWKGEEGRSVWMCPSVKFIDALEREIFLAEFPTDEQHALSGASISRAGAESAALALCDGIAQALFVVTGNQARARETSPAPEQHVLSNGSGAIRVDLRLGDQMLVIVVNHTCVCALPDMPLPILQKKLDDVDPAMTFGQVPISLSVCVGSVAVGIASFVRLAVGDVIRLPAPVERPLNVLAPAGHVLFAGHLGMIGHTIAIEVTTTSKRGD